MCVQMSYNEEYMLLVGEEMTTCDRLMAMTRNLQVLSSDSNVSSDCEARPLTVITWSAELATASWAVLSCFRRLDRVNPCSPSPSIGLNCNESDR